MAKKKYYDIYDSNTDYAKLMNDAVRSGDLESAAVYENQRNAKIRGEGLNYETTSAYAKYLPNSSSVDGTSSKPTYKSTSKKPSYSGGGSFSYEDAPSYVNKYSDKIEDLSNAILNREAFSYDPYNDPLYSSYKKTYTREGQRAAADTLGQYATMTGGVPSTAAVAASQQAGNYYAAQLADKIPELQQLAYAMYVDEGNAQRNNLNMLTGLEQSDYQKYLNALNQYNTDRNFAYGVFSDDRNFDYQQYLNDLNQYNADRNFEYNQYLSDLGQYNTDRNFEYQTGRDAISDARYADEIEYTRQLAARKEAQDQINAYLSAGGKSGSLSSDLLTASGYEPAYLAALENYYAMQAQSGNGTGSSSGRRSSSGRSRSSSSSGGGSGSNPGIWSKVEEYEAIGGDPDDYISANYKALGFSTASSAKAAYRVYRTQTDYDAEDGETTEGINVPWAEATESARDIASTYENFAKLDSQLQAMAKGKGTFQDIANSLDYALRTAQITQAQYLILYQKYFGAKKSSNTSNVDYEELISRLT